MAILMVIAFPGPSYGPYPYTGQLVAAIIFSLVLFVLMDLFRKPLISLTTMQCSPEAQSKNKLTFGQPSPPAKK